MSLQHQTGTLTVDRKDHHLLLLLIDPGSKSSVVFVT